MTHRVSGDEVPCADRSRIGFLPGTITQFHQRVGPHRLAVPVTEGQDHTGQRAPRFALALDRTEYVKRFLVLGGNTDQLAKMRSHLGVEPLQAANAAKIGPSGKSFRPPQPGVDPK